MEKGIRPLRQVLKWCSIVTLFLLMPFITASVVGRYIFNRPILGDVEIVELLMVIVIMFGLASTQASEAHVSVKLVVDRLQKKAQTIIDMCTYLIVTGILVLLTWQGLIHALKILRAGESTDILEIPLAYFRFMVPIGFLAWTLETFLKSLRSINELRNRNLR